MPRLARNIPARNRVGTATPSTPVRFVYCIALFCVSLLSAAAQSFMGIDRARLQDVIDQCYNLAPAAPASIDALAREHPDSLVPEIMRVQRLYWMQAYAEKDAQLTEDYELAAEALLPRALKFAHRHEDDRDAVFLAAVNQLSLGLYYVETGRIWAAFWKIRAGRGTAARLLAEDPDYHDAKLPVGLSECYLERTPGYLKPLTLLLGGSGNMEQGLRHLGEAADHGLLTAVEARFHLAQVRFSLLRDERGATAEMRRLVDRYPRNPFFQRLLAYGECRSGQREAGRARYWRCSEMPEAAAYPALAVRPLTMLCWDAMGTRDYAEALRAAETAELYAKGKDALRHLLGEAILGQAEALKALGRYEESFARFDTLATEFPDHRRHALSRVRDIKKEIKGTEPASAAASGPGR